MTNSYPTPLSGNSANRSANRPPIFIHSLWRAGSTYLFKSFRRIPARYWCYQEPVHEEMLRCRQHVDELLLANAEAVRTLRHPTLDAPYFFEAVQTHAAWRDLIGKSMIYDHYFSANDPRLSAYLTSLIDAARGQPVLQECRTANRIGAIKQSIGGFHLYLYRNPWDQWWSFKCTDYFDVAAQMVLNASPCPPAIARLREIIRFVDCHAENIVDEMLHFNGRRLNADDSYLTFFMLWCLAWLEAQKHADLFICIDSLSESPEYRNTVLAQLEHAGIGGLNFDDCSLYRASYGESDEHFFHRNEARAFQILLDTGHSLESLALLRQAALDTQFAPPPGNPTQANLLEDGERARNIVRRLETSHANANRHQHEAWARTEAGLREEATKAVELVARMSRACADREAALIKEWTAKFEAQHDEYERLVAQLMAQIAPQNEASEKNTR